MDLVTAAKMFSPKFRKTSKSNLASPQKNAKTGQELMIQECIKVFKRKELSSVKQSLTLVHNPSAIKVTYKPEWDDYFVNPRHVTLLHLAAENGWCKICDDLIRLYNFDPEVTDDQGVYTPLHYAIGGKTLDVVYLLLEKHKCDPHCLKSPVSPMHLACKIGKMSIVDHLLTVRNCNPNLYDHLHNTPLHYAVSRGHLEVVLIILANNKVRKLLCNVDGDTPLHLASRLGFYSIVVSILNHINVELSLCINNVGDTPLHESARNGYTKIVRHLLSASGTSPVVNVCNTIHNTPLHEASKFGHSDVIQTLLNANGINPSIKNCSGDTPLHMACRNGHLNAVQTLLCNKLVYPFPLNNARCTPFNVSKPTIKKKVEELIRQRLY